MNQKHKTTLESTLSYCTIQLFTTIHAFLEMINIPISSK